MTLGAAAYATALYGGPTAAAATAGTFPAVAVEVAFTAGVWTDVSLYVRSISTTRGRQRELDKVAAGTCDVVLANTDRRFDPTYADGPYYPNVLPNRRLRVRATWAGVTYSLFDGYVDRWQSAYGRQKEATVTVEATDGFGVLAAADLPSSPYAAEVTVDDPVAWWRLGDPDASTVAVDSIGEYDLTRTGDGVTLGESSLISRDGDGAARIIDDSAGAQDGFSRFGPAVIPAAPLTAEIVVQVVGPAEDGTLTGQVSAFGAAGFALGTNGTQAIAAVATGPGLGGTITGTSNVCDGLIHHLALTWEAGGTFRLYVDGVVEASAVLTPAAFPASAYTVIGGSTIGVDNDDGVDALYDEVAWYATALSADRIAAHVDALTSPWDGDTAGERVDRILDLADWPTADREVSDGEAVLQYTDLNGAALEYLQTIEDTEQGLFYVRPDGVAVFRSRHEILTPPFTTPLATFGDGDGELEYVSIKDEYGKTLVFNDVTAARVEGVAQRASDADSRSEYGRRSLSKTGLLHQDDATSRYLTEWLLARYKDPALRITEMVVQPYGGDADALFPVVLAADLGNRLEANRRPQELGDPIEQTVVVEGISHVIEELSWETTLTLSPHVAAWVLDVSALDVDTRPGF